jgi:hypothetical protein
MSANRLLAIVSLVLATGAAGAEKAPPPPDPDMLEFLGAFETSGGKAVDPFLLENTPGKPAKLGKAATRAQDARKPAQKETPPKGREKNDA